MVNDDVRELLDDGSPRGVSPLSVETAMVGLAESMMALISVSKERVPRRMIRRYKSELYEALEMVRSCFVRKREMYLSLGDQLQLGYVSGEWEADIARMHNLATLLRRESVGEDAPSLRPARRRGRNAGRRRKT